MQASTLQTPGASLSAATLERAATGGVLLPVVTLTRREIVRFLRQRNLVVGALLQPLIFWVLFGAAFTTSFKPPEGSEGMSYQEYFFPGTVVMILLFTAIFSTISIIEDRKEGFLQSVLVAPISRAAIVLGKIFGGTLLAFGQGLLFLLMAPFIGVHFGLLSFALSCAFLLVVSFALTGLGFCIAW